MATLYLAQQTKLFWETWRAPEFSEIDIKHNQMKLITWVQQPRFCITQSFTPTKLSEMKKVSTK